MPVVITEREVETNNHRVPFGLTLRMRMVRC